MIDGAQLPTNIRMMYDGFRFYVDVKRDFASGTHLQLPFGEYLKKGTHCTKSCVGVFAWKVW